MRSFYVIFLFLSFVVVCCKQEDKLPDTYIDKFYKNEVKFDTLIEVLKKDTFLEYKSGQTFKPTQFNNSTKQRLEDLGVDEVLLFSWGHDQRQFGFKTHWRKTEPIHVWYNTLDSIETVEGYYLKDRNNNEMWGLGNSWCLWVERKLRDAIQ